MNNGVCVYNGHTHNAEEEGFRAGETSQDISLSGESGLPASIWSHT